MVVVSKLDIQDFKDLATRMLESGPIETKPATPRRHRILFNSKYILDTTSAVYVWEHWAYPWLYVPKKDFTKDAEFEELDVVKRPGTDDVAYRILRLKSGDKSTDRVILFEGFTKRFTELNGMIRVDFHAVDQWFEEDMPMVVHPKDPFKRVDTLPSSRVIRVELEGILLGESPFAVHLFETGLPCRYYLPQTHIRRDLLRPSNHLTACPYKGEAQYYDVVLPPAKEGESERIYKNLVWYYIRPNLECAPIAGLACFYNEKVEVYIDGVKEVQPKTHMA